jgi:hypothetical protein
MRALVGIELGRYLSLGETFVEPNLDRLHFADVG